MSQTETRHRFLPVTPVAGQRWRGQESGRKFTLVEKLPEALDPDGTWWSICPDKPGQPDRISEWQLSWCTPIDSGESS